MTKALAAAALIWVAVSCASGTASATTVRVGVWSNPPKMVLGGAQGPSGIYVEVLRDLAQHQGYQFEYVSGSLQEGFDRLRRGEIDLMAEVTRTPERERQFEYSQEPVVQSWNEILVRKGLPVHDFADLTGKTVAVLAGSFQQTQLEQEKRSRGVVLTLMPYSTYEESFAAARSGLVDAVAANPFIGQRHRKDLTRTSIVFGWSTNHFVSRKGEQTRLLADIDRRLQLMKTDPYSTYYRSLQALVAAQRETGIPDWLVQLAASAGIVALLAAGWALSARRSTARLRRAESQQRQLAEERMVLLCEAQRRERELQLASADLRTVSFSLSHDLRQPLAAISTFLETVMQRAASELDERSAHLLRRSQHSAARIEQMVRDLGDMLRTAGEPLHCAECDISALARDVAENLRNDTGRRPEVVIAPGLHAHADIRMIRTVLENLMGNAWKFSSRLSAPRIEVGCQGEDGQHKTFFVRDNGAGFDPEYAGNLFRPFSRLHGQDEFAGTGMGLSIVERIIVRHGGRVWAEGAPDRGATFYFTLPVRSAENQGPGLPLATSVTPTGTAT